MRRSHVIVVILLILALGGAYLQHQFTRMNLAVSRSKSEDHIKWLLICVRSDLDRYLKRIPQHTGKNFILTAMANGRLSPNKPHDIQCHWPPGSKLPPPSAYEQVTWESLKTRRFPHLTGYVGPRDPNAGAVEGYGTPWIADLSRSDGIIVGWKKGSVSFLSWEQLGIEMPTWPFTPFADDVPRVLVGPDATHPLLQALSDR